MLLCIVRDDCLKPRYVRTKYLEIWSENYFL